MGTLATDIFLKGYQWPFDPRKIAGYGSSLIDLLVYIETAIKGRRVFMDFRENPRAGGTLKPFDFEDLHPEARQYLEKSGALLVSPIERLRKMNPMAIELYRRNGIDISKEPLEVAVCAQHNNGGLSGDIWWESNIRHLFPVGEVNGSHGVYRPGGTALNSGQVGSLRAAQRIARMYKKQSFDYAKFESAAGAKAEEILGLLRGLRIDGTKTDVDDFRREFQSRMTENGAHIRKSSAIAEACAGARKQFLSADGQTVRSRSEIPDYMKNRHLCLSHAAYLDAIRFYLEAGGGSRGSYLVVGDGGSPVIEKILPDWKTVKENESFREQVLETVWNPDSGSFSHEFVSRRPVPADDSWFENVWSDFISGNVFRE
jgi:succinate dehydrogenase/fumarate reductase flavoprotein subunit